MFYVLNLCERNGKRVHTQTRKDYADLLGICHDRRCHKCLVSLQVSLTGLREHSTKLGGGRAMGDSAGAGRLCSLSSLLSLEGLVGWPAVGRAAVDLDPLVAVGEEDARLTVELVEPGRERCTRGLGAQQAWRPEGQLRRYTGGAFNMLGRACRRAGPLCRWSSR